MSASAAYLPMDQFFFGGVLTGLLFSASGLYGFASGFFAASILYHKMGAVDVLQIWQQVLSKVSKQSPS
jgi:hypothetical protein